MIAGIRDIGGGPRVRRVLRGLAGTAAAALLLGTVLGGCKGPIDREAEAVFKRDLSTSSVTVFPGLVRTGQEVTYDAAGAERIAEHLRGLGMTVTVVGTEVPLGTEWGMNQARMWRDSAAGFQAYLDNHLAGTDYALMPEYLRGPTEAGGVHAYIVNADGVLAGGLLLNSHHAVFSNAQPKTAEDCTGVLLAAFDEAYVDGD